MDMHLDNVIIYNIEYWFNMTLEEKYFKTL